MKAMPSLIAGKSIPSVSLCIYYVCPCWFAHTFAAFFSFQLVYAIGDQVELPEGESRWTIIEALLKLLVRSDATTVQNIVADPTLVHKEACPSGSFPRIRLLSAFKGSEKMLGKALCNALIQSPPHELRWIRNLKTLPGKLNSS